MDIHFPEGMHFDCNACGKCCRTRWNVYVDPHAHEVVRASDMYARMKADLGGREIIEKDEAEGTSRITAKHADGSCIFLAPDRLCGIHKELGVTAKPLGCRQFPFLITKTPDGWYVGLSHYCDAVRLDQGRPVEEHRAEVEGFLREYHYPEITEQGLLLDHSIHLDWDGYLVLEAFIDGCLASDALEDGLWRALVAVGMVVLAARRDGRTRVDAEGLLTVLQRQGPASDDVMRAQAEFFTLAVVGSLESTTGAQARVATEALLSEGTLASGTCGRDIDLRALAHHTDAHVETWRTDRFRRYLRHLVFRKYLAGPEPLFSALCALQVIHRLLEFYFNLSAYAAARPVPDERDMEAALDAVERGFSEHTARSNRAYFEAFAEGTLEQLATA